MKRLKRWLAAVFFIVALTDQISLSASPATKPADTAATHPASTTQPAPDASYLPKINVTSKAVGVFPVKPIQANAPAGNSAVFVGINVFKPYANLQPLRFAVDDAIAQAHLFVLELKLIPPQNCWLCLGGEPAGDLAKMQMKELAAAGITGEDAGHTSILICFSKSLAISHESADLIIISLSTHGFEDRGVPYAMPTDGVRDMLSQSGLNLQSMAQQMAQCKAGKGLLIVDACRKDAMAGAKGGMEPMTAAFHKALDDAKGHAALFSCNIGQVSIEDTNLGHGLFTHFLLKGLHGAAPADGHGFITVDSVAKYVSENVPDWQTRNQPALRPGDAQHPWFQGAEESRQIPLAIDPTRQEQFIKLNSEINKTLHDLKSLTDEELKGPFKWAIYLRITKVLSSPDPYNREWAQLLRECQSFATGKTPEAVFIPYVIDALSRLEVISANVPAPAIAPTGIRISQLLLDARSHDNKIEGKKALAALDEILKAEPDNAEAKTLREKISGYYIFVNTAGAKFDVLINGLGMEFVKLGPGKFKMGSPFNEAGRSLDEKLHALTLTRPFAMGRHHVTKAQFQAFVAATGYKTDAEGAGMAYEWDKSSGFIKTPQRSWKDPGFGQGDNEPVVCVSWNDAQAFCRWLGGNELGACRLPSEAEWEYACRAGTTTPYPWGVDPIDGKGWCNVADIAAKKHMPPKMQIFNFVDGFEFTSPVGRFQPNEFGLYDMIGNAYQWCSDVYDKQYDDDAIDPVRAPTPGTNPEYVIRGGSWANGPKSCRAAFRARRTADAAYCCIGFRCVVDVK